MSKKPDPKKTIVLKPNQRRRRRRDGRAGKSDEWVEHKSSYALDPWGVAIRALRERGIPVD
ncbi:MAG: hypothetical protein GWP61_24740 [Chloroflexi bacterium]|jgi:hypothetical protein|nr:hypothetical protein [Chloroflexota bacterium]